MWCVCVCVFACVCVCMLAIDACCCSYQIDYDRCARHVLLWLLFLSHSLQKINNNNNKYVVKPFSVCLCYNLEYPTHIHTRTPALQSTLFTAAATGYHRVVWGYAWLQLLDLWPASCSCFVSSFCFFFWLIKAKAWGEGWGEERRGGSVRSILQIRALLIISIIIINKFVTSAWGSSRRRKAKGAWP